MLRKSYYLLLCALCAPLLGLASAVAQETDSLLYLLKETVVQERERMSDTESASPLQTVGRRSIVNLGLHNLSDAVKLMSGVDVRDYGGAGGLKTVSVRGLGAKHTAVSYDGVMVSDAQSGIVDLGRFPLENVGAVSLAVGESDNWGPRTARESAYSSHLSLRTLRPLDNTAYVKLQGGSFGYAGVSAFGNYLLSSDCFKGVSLFANYMRSDGMYPFELVNGNMVSNDKRRDGDAEALLVEANSDFSVLGGGLSAKVHYYSSERGLPGSVNLYNKENRERLWNRNLFVQAVYKKAFNESNALQAVLKYDYNYTRYREVNVNYAAGEQTDINRQNELYASVAFKGDCGTLFGYSGAADASYATLNNNFKNGGEPRRLSSFVSLSAWRSGQWGRVQAALLAQCVSDDVSGKASPSPYKRLSPSLGLSLKPFGSLPLRLRFSFKDAYRVPTFADLYYLRLGNVGLKPERATQCNAGMTWDDRHKTLGSFSITLDGYYNSVRDKIVALPTMYIWRMMNFGEVQIFGVDANASWSKQLAKGCVLSCSMNYSWQHAVDVTDKAAKNYRHQLPYTPEHSGNLSLVCENPFVNISYVLSLVGERYMLPQNSSRNRMSGYAEHSFSLNREFLLGGSKLRLQGELLNVGNEKYEVIRYYPMPGFSWRLSATLTL